VLWLWLCNRRVHLLKVAWYAALHQSSVTFVCRRRWPWFLLSSDRKIGVVD